MTEPVTLWHDDGNPDDAGWYSVKIGDEMAEWRALPAAEFDRLTRERDEARALLEEVKARQGEDSFPADLMDRINAAIGRKEG